MRGILYIVLVGIIAGSGVLVAKTWLDGQRRPVAVAAPAPEAPFKEVMVAAADLGTGSFIQPTSLRWQRWPDVTLPRAYLVRGAHGIDDLVGAVVRQPMHAGEPIVEESVVKPGDRGFLAAVLTPGMRAVSVPVDEASSNAGLIFPGDRVDLILTQTLRPEQEDSAKAPRRVSETILDNVRVLAMGRRLSNPRGEEAATVPVRTTTLEVSPAAAEKVALITELGKLSLSLRSLAMADPSQSAAASGPARVTWDHDVSHALDDRGAGASSPGVIVIRGDSPRAASSGKDGSS
jgi:pilus assembly protein CpaB